MSRSCRADEMNAAKLNSWNGEKVKRTRPSPAFRSLITASPFMQPSYEPRKEMSVQKWTHSV